MGPLHTPGPDAQSPLLVFHHRFRLGLALLGLHHRGIFLLLLNDLFDFFLDLLRLLQLLLALLLHGFVCFVSLLVSDVLLQLLLFLLDASQHLLAFAFFAAGRHHLAFIHHHHLVAAFLVLAFRFARFHHLFWCLHYGFVVHHCRDFSLLSRLGDRHRHLDGFAVGLGLFLGTGLLLLFFPFHVRLRFRSLLCIALLLLQSQFRLESFNLFVLLIFCEDFTLGAFIVSFIVS
mmetsp:Transcript_11090/g.16708  ORF Transcript_11090/g.16708 Transcript_11090/m.16708 type:complete len:232 (-) Transcript_11090:108-803(-)